jgi:hypothetical protein
MLLVVVSVFLALLGVVASRVSLASLTKDDASRDPHAYWILGMCALLPAWLVAFVGLLGSQPDVRPRLVSGVAFMLSVAAGLVGVIATEARVRETGDSVEARHATRLWRLGALAFVPAWVVVLIGYAAR